MCTYILKVAYKVDLVYTIFISATNYLNSENVTQAVIILLRRHPLRLTPFIIALLFISPQTIMKMRGVHCGQDE